MPRADFARWTAGLTASYLAITAALIASRGQGIPGRGWLVAAHLTLAASLLILNRARPSARGLFVIRDWHPLILFPVLYKEVELLAAVIGDWRLTAAVPAWESALFGGQPSLYLSERLPFVPLSEYLHFCYLSHVIVIPALSAYWYVSGRRAAFGELLLMLSTAMLGSYLFFILLPVDSPYYLSERLGPPLSGHVFFDLVHQMSARGGARGGAFPSAHVSGALVVTLVAWRHQRRLSYVLVPFTLSVMVATVYGRFHYVLDVIAGAALAIAVVTIYRRYLFGDSERASRASHAAGSEPAKRRARARVGESEGRSPSDRIRTMRRFWGTPGSVPPPNAGVSVDHSGPAGAPPNRRTPWLPPPELSPTTLPEPSSK
jgi:membrane-associated phospholipid phosphatase